MKVTFIGGGNMATALIAGLVKRGGAAGDIRVVEVIAEAREKLAREFGVAAAGSPAEVVPGSEVIVLAVKPQQLAEVCRAVAPHAGNALIVSIAAGIRLEDIARWFGGPRRMVRCMPNTPALIGMGVTAAFASPDTTDADRSAAAAILEAVGRLVWVEREMLLDPVTAVSGSGPAYVFYFLEAMMRAADEMGLGPEVGRALAIETFRGAAELAARAGEPPEVLRGRVTSKGGTTAAAIASFDADHVKDAIVRGLLAANRRAGELASEFGKL